MKKFMIIYGNSCWKEIKVLLVCAKYNSYNSINSSSLSHADLHGAALVVHLSGGAIGQDDGECLLALHARILT